MTSTLSQPEHNVSFEHQRQLAKLLAKENIRVRQGNYKTAFFDVKNRVLGLPTWNLDSKDVSDLLVGHEVGHAHWTPKDGIPQYHRRFGKQAPFDIANVVEDIRIERKILTLFPGLVSSFTKGYTYLLEKDFFKLEGRNPNELNFLDRLNLKGKLRHLVDVEFDEWETEIYNRCLRAETYEEVLDICGDIIDNLPKEKPQPPQEEDPDQPSSPSQDSDEGEGDDDSMDFGQDLPEQDVDEDDPDANPEGQEEEEEDGSESESVEPTETSAEEDEDGGDEEGSVRSDDKEAGKDEVDYSDAISETQRALDEELENSQEDLDGTIYVDAPNRQQINDCISTIDEVRKARREKLSIYNNVMTDPAEEDRWVSFKKDSKKNVALLVREFERKKSAYEYSRAQTSATGSIDPNKIHTYKYDDQIFKSVTRLATSKDHGMVFFVDWSGSMNRVLHDVIQQTLQLAFFCKAVGIPFSVYGFTTAMGARYYQQDREGMEGQVGHVVDLRGASVFEILNSTLGKREFEDACKEVFVGSRGYSNIFQSDLERMGGTPLFDTILCAAEIVNRFRAQHNVQKLHTMFLTDGESGALQYAMDYDHASFEKRSEKEEDPFYHDTRKEILRWGNAMIGPNAFRTRDRNTTYRQLILNFKKLTGSSAICFFLGDSRDCKSAGINAIVHSSKFKANSWYNGTEEYKTLRKKTLKDKSRTIFIDDGMGYDGYFIVEASKVKIENTELEVDKDLDYSKASDVNHLAKKFSTQNRDKRASRVFLTKFSNLIS